MRKSIMFLIVVSIVVSAFCFEPLKERSLIAYFPFDGDFKDASGKFGEAEITGSTIGGAVLGRVTIEFKDGIKGNGAYFPGRRGLILPEDLVKDYDYTFAFWVKPEKFTMHTTTFFGIFVDEKQGYHWVSFVPFGWNQGTLLWSNDSVASIWFDGLLEENLQIEKWYHVAVAVNKGRVQVYINGKPVLKTVQINGQPNPEGLLPDVFSIKPGGIFALGVNYWDPAFQGMIDELWIFDRPLTQEEVMVLYEFKY